MFIVILILGIVLSAQFPRTRSHMWYSCILSFPLSYSSSLAKWERASVTRGVLCHQPPRLLRLVFQGKRHCCPPHPAVTALIGVSAASLDEESTCVRRHTTEQVEVGSQILRSPRWLTACLPGISPTPVLTVTAL